MKHSFYIVLIILVLQDVVKGQQTIGIFTNDSLAMNGYTLFSPNLYTYLIDNCGRVVNDWRSNSTPGLSSYLLENGNLVRAGAKIGDFNGPGHGGLIEEFNWEGDLIWSFKVSNAEFQQHHDIEILPNGNILFIAWELRTPEEAEAMGARNAVRYWAPAVYEIKKIGADSADYVWEWHLWNHLIQDHDPQKLNFGVVSEHPELFNINMEAPESLGPADWLHLNSIDYDPMRDEIILSSRNMSEIYIIDHSTTAEEAAGHSGGSQGKGGDFLYRWGNPRAYDKGSNIEQRLFGQHDAQVVPSGYPGAGNITLFNNGIDRPQGIYSSIEEIRPPRDGNGNYYLESDGTFGPKTVEWQFTTEDKESFYSSNMGGVNRLSNGNTLICDSRGGRFFEVTPAGEIVWDYESPAGYSGTLSQGQNNNGIAASFRADKYSIDFAGFDGKDMSPGDVIEFDPLPLDCVIHDAISSTKETNPFSDIQLSFLQNQFLHLESETNTPYQFIVMDLGGYAITSGTVDDFVRLDLAYIPTGIYLVNIRNRNMNSTQKIFKR